MMVCTVEWVRLSSHQPITHPNCVLGDSRPSRVASAVATVVVADPQGARSSRVSTVRAAPTVVATEVSSKRRRKKRKKKKSGMKLLVFNASTRAAVTIEGTATGWDLKTKVSTQTNGTWPPERQLLQLRGEAIADELTLAEQGVLDRDRIELCDASQVTGEAAADGADVAASDGPGSDVLVERAFMVMDATEKSLAELTQQVEQQHYVHQEHFTRLLEKLDTLVLEGLSDEARALVRPQRKALARRIEEISETAAAIPRAR